MLNQQKLCFLLLHPDGEVYKAQTTWQMHKSILASVSSQAAGVIRMKGFLLGKHKVDQLIDHQNDHFKDSGCNNSMNLKDELIYSDMTIIQ